MRTRSLVLIAAALVACGAAHAHSARSGGPAARQHVFAYTRLGGVLLDTAATRIAGAPGQGGEGTERPPRSGTALHASGSIQQVPGKRVRSPDGENSD